MGKTKSDKWKKPESARRLHLLVISTNFNFKNFSSFEWVRPLANSIGFLYDWPGFQRPLTIDALPMKIVRVCQRLDS